MLTHNKLFSDCKSDEVRGVYPWFFEKWRYRDDGHLELKTDTR